MVLRRLFQPIIRNLYYRFKFYMRPRTKDEVEDTRELLSKIYLCLAGLSFVACAYLVSFNYPTLSAEQWVQARKIQGPVRIIKFEGFSKVKDYVYKLPDDNNQTESDPQNTQSPKDNLEDLK